jgi:hypothetical protein
MMIDPILIQEQIKELNDKMDLDKEFVQVIAIVSAAVVVVAAMIFDGEVGDAVGTILLTGGAAAVSYLVGKSRCDK